MYKTKIDLSEKIRRNVIAILNDRLADAIDLQSQVKQAHWNVKGPQLHRAARAVRQDLRSGAGTDRRNRRTRHQPGWNRGRHRGGRRQAQQAEELSARASPPARITCSICRRRSRRSANPCAPPSTTPTSWAMRIPRICSPAFRAISTSTCGFSKRTCRTRPDATERLRRSQCRRSGRASGARHAAGAADDAEKLWKPGRCSIACCAHASACLHRGDQRPIHLAQPALARRLRVRRYPLAGPEGNAHQRRDPRRGPHAGRAVQLRSEHRLRGEPRLDLRRACARIRRRRMYRICQQHDQVWREKRRVRELEELRAKSGGVQIGGRRRIRRGGRGRAAESDAGAPTASGARNARCQAHQRLRIRIHQGKNRLRPVAAFGRLARIAALRRLLDVRRRYPSK